MVNIIVGQKGSGKTKKLISLVNDRANTSSGQVICVEKTPNLTCVISSKVRLIETEEYKIEGFEAFFGFLSGICASNYDITDVFVDATFKIVERRYCNLPIFFKTINDLSERLNVTFCFTLSCNKEDLPAEIYKYCNII